MWPCQSLSPFMDIRCFLYNVCLSAAIAPVCPSVSLGTAVSSSHNFSSGDADDLLPLMPCVHTMGHAIAFNSVFVGVETNRAIGSTHTASAQYRIPGSTHVPISHLVRQHVCLPPCEQEYPAPPQPLSLEQADIQANKDEGQELLCGFP